MMKIFSVKYSYDSSEREETILLAESMEAAKGMAEEEARPYEYKWIDSLEELELQNYRAMYIQEVESKPGIVFTGYYCC
jgi:hypothetical protein